MTAAITTAASTTNEPAADDGFAECRQDETFGCYQRGFRAIVNAQNPGVALDKLDALSKTDNYVLRTCHPLAHEIGHLAFAKYKTVQGAEGYARETCWSGYHHGVMESYISQFNDGQLQKRMNTICKQDAGHPYSLAYYNCWHGLGHGLTIRFTQDVFRSLDFCDYVDKSWERQSCFSGVFMQNIVANGSGMHKAVDLKPSDPIYPCDKVTKEQKPSCYLMQTSYVLQVKNWNLPAAFKDLRRRRGRLRRHLLPLDGPRHLGRRPARAGEGRGAVQHGRERPPRRVHRGRGRERRLRPPRPADGRRAVQARAQARSRRLQGRDRAGRLDALRPRPRLVAPAASSTSVRYVRFLLAIATLAAVAAFGFGGLAASARSGAAGPSADGDDRSGVGGALSFRARVVAPHRSHPLALQKAYARSHGRLPPPPRRVLEATHRQVLWALATFALDGKVVAERFSWRSGQGWRALGPTKAGCPAVPAEVRSAWRLTACQTS